MSRSPATRATSCGPARSTPQAACSAARSSSTCSTTASTPNQTAADYTRLISQDHVDLLLVEHDVAFLASLSDLVYVMANGKIIACGTVAEVSADQAVVDAYLGDQVALATAGQVAAARHMESTS
jgi:ABC-type glutathione transport system ATPase component